MFCTIFFIQLFLSYSYRTKIKILLRILRVKRWVNGRICKSSQALIWATYLQVKKAKTRKLSELSKTEQNRLTKLNWMLDELRRGENLQNHRLAIWLTEEGYVSFVSDWENQQQVREELKDKPDELRRYVTKTTSCHFQWRQSGAFP